MKIKNLHDALLLKLKSLYDAEEQILAGLEKMIKNVDSLQLKQALQAHYDETEAHVERLENVFDRLDMKPVKVKVEGVRGILNDMNSMIKQSSEKPALDSLLISHFQYMEHYEIAGYKSAISWAELLGYDEIGVILEETLEEEEAASETLAEIAEIINDEAHTTTDGADEDEE